MSEESPPAKRQKTDKSERLWDNVPAIVYTDNGREDVENSKYIIGTHFLKRHAPINPHRGVGKEDYSYTDRHMCYIDGSTYSTLTEKKNIYKHYADVKYIDKKKGIITMKLYDYTFTAVLEPTKTFHPMDFDYDSTSSDRIMKNSHIGHKINKLTSIKYDKNTS